MGHVERLHMSRSAKFREGRKLEKDFLGAFTSGGMRMETWRRCLDDVFLV